MPFCEYCGRPIADNEVCNCRNGEAPVAPPPVNINGQPVYGAPQGASQKKEGGLWWIWLIIVPVVLVFLIVLAMLAAIFVPAYIGYQKKAKISSANADASSLYKAVNTALVEFDEEGYNINGYFIISSDEDNNWNLPDYNFDLDDFYTRINNYYDKTSDLEWFVIVENGCATYSAASTDWSSERVGTYPSRATVDGPVLYGRYSASYGKYSLTKVYNEASKELDNKPKLDYDDYGSYSYF